MRSWIPLCTLALAGALLGGACAPSAKTEDTTRTGTGAAATTPDTNLTGDIKIDGSSTVYPIVEAFASKDGFGKIAPNVKTMVAQAGTGAGFEIFARGEIDIAVASRPIKDSEIEALKKANIEFVEVPIAFDGLTVVVNKENTWAKSMTIDDLKRVWHKDSKIANWNEVNPAFPDQRLVLFGPTEAHGTYDYFNETVNGGRNEGRQDYNQFAEFGTMSPAIATEKGAMGYFGIAYYEENKDSLGVIAIDGGNGPVIPSPETVQDGTYSPLSRPLLIYINKKSLAKPEVKAFVKFALLEGSELVSETGYVPLPADIYTKAWERVEKGITGAVFNTFKPGMSMADALSSGATATSTK
ncbi:MAG: PstS family phosphate ABC transporter substrate-binding protein [Fimbriimonadaceae bacterium]